MNVLKVTYRRLHQGTTPNNGIGDRVQRVIHAGLDALPIGDKTRNAIKKCGGCAKRKAMLNKAGESVSDAVTKLLS